MTLCNPWITSADLCAPCDQYGAADDIDRHILVASELLFMLSGQQFPGECEVTVHPCAYSWFTDHALTNRDGILTLRDTTYASVCGCSSGWSCSCQFQSSIDLPYRPISEIVAVQTADDGLLDESAYGFHGQTLVRLDGGKWPLCDDDFLVTYKYGTPVPESGKLAAAILACELAIGCNPDGFEDVECKLPRNVVSVVRQGVSVAMQSAFFTARRGQAVQFGVMEIDTFLAAYNPHGLTAPSAILSPDEDDLGYVVT